MKVVRVKNSQEGIVFAKESLYEDCNKNTVLFLSGGETPKPLYKILATEQILKIGALAMVDERYSLHEKLRNEFMVKESGLVQFIEQEGGAFFSILEYGLSLTKTAEKYDNTARFLFNKFPKRVAVLGIGADGHIASLPSDSSRQGRGSPKAAKFKVKSLEFVSFVRSFPSEPKVPRISLNIKTLSLMDLLIVIAFGEEKKEGIKIALKTFFKGQTAKITVLITDQKV